MDKFSKAIEQAKNALLDSFTESTMEQDYYWITVRKGEVGYSRGDFRCPVCKQVNPCYHPTNYCANCGARMRGVKPREKTVSDRR